MGGLSFAVGLSGALSPGPLTVLALREAARRGWWAGPLATAGHGAVELPVVVLLSLGLSRVVGGDGSVAAAVSLAGGAILLYMGLALMRTPRERLQAELDGVGLHGAREAPGLRAVSAVAPAAALVSLANPYWFMWWASVGTKLTADSLSAGPAGPGAFFVGHILADLAWLTLVASAVGAGRRRMSARLYRGLLTASALFLLGLGALFLAGGVRAIA